MKIFILILVTSLLNADLLTNPAFSSVPGNIFYNPDDVVESKSVKTIYCYRQLFELWSCTMQSDCEVKDIKNKTHTCYQTKKEAK